MIERGKIPGIPAASETLPDEGADFVVHKIPLLSRLNLINSDSIPQRSFSLEELADTLGAETAWVAESLDLVGIDAIVDASRGLELPGYALPVIAAEKLWQDHYNALPDLVSKTEMTEVLGMSRGIIGRLASELGYTPTVVDVNCMTRHLYPKRALLEMRSRITEILPDDTSVTLDHLMELTGLGRTWVVNHLEEAGYTHEDLWSDTVKRICRHYPEAAEDYLVELRRTMPDKAPEGWVTMRQVRDKLARGETWAKARITRYEAYGVELLDVLGRPQTHYPPFVFEELSAMSESDKALLPLGQNLLIPEAMKATGYTRATLLTVLNALNITPEKRRAIDDRIFDTLRPEQVEEIANFDLDQYAYTSLKKSIKEFGEGHVEASIEIDRLRDEIRALELGAESSEETDQMQLHRDLAAVKALARSFARRRFAAMKRLEELDADRQVA